MEPSSNQKKGNRLRNSKKTGKTYHHPSHAKDTHGPFNIRNETLKRDVEKGPIDQPDQQYDHHN